ncbi:NADPH-dependent FMN reductase, partial [Shigella flexneri]
LQTHLDTALETFWQALHRRDVQVPDLLSLRGNVHA